MPYAKMSEEKMLWVKCQRLPGKNAIGNNAIGKNARDKKTIYTRLVLYLFLM